MGAVSSWEGAALGISTKTPPNCLIWAIRSILCTKEGRNGDLMPSLGSRPVIKLQRACDGSFETGEGMRFFRVLSFSAPCGMGRFGLQIPRGALQCPFT